MFIVGGAVWLSMARMVTPASRLPAPPSRWPVMDLVELDEQGVVGGAFAEDVFDRLRTSARRRAAWRWPAR